MKQIFKRTACWMLTWAMVMSMFSTVFAAGETGYLTITDKTVELDGSGSKEVTVTLAAREAMTVVGLQGYWDIGENVMSGEYLHLTDIKSEVLVPSPELGNDYTVEDGYCVWMDNSFAGKTFEAGQEVLTATYTVDKNTPDGDYFINFEAIVVMTKNGKVIENESDVLYTATITVTTNTPEPGKTPLDGIEDFEVTGLTKTYDGTTNVSNDFKVSVKDDPNAVVTYTASYDNANVGDRKITVSVTGVTGNYELTGDLSALQFDGKIEPLSVNEEKLETEIKVPVKHLQFTEPVFDGYEGDLAYTYYGNQITYDEIVADLGELTVGEFMTVGYIYTLKGNHTGTITGTLKLTIVDVTATAGEGTLTIKENPTYGNKWSEIVTVSDASQIIVKVGDDIATVGEDSTFTVANGDTMPNAGDNQPVKVLFNGTIDGKEYTDLELTVGTVNVAKKTITVEGLGVDQKTYDGTNAATVCGDAQLDGTLSDDDVVLETGTATFDTENVGENKHITFSGYALTGTAAGNYELQMPTDVTGTIKAKAVTITGISAQDKNYDGNAEATITGTHVIDGMIEGDDVSVVKGTATFDNKNAGDNKTVTFSGFSLTGADADNYNLKEQPAAVNANINPRILTVSGVKVDEKEYDGRTEATVSEVHLTGAVSGETLTKDTDYTVTAAFDTADVGYKDVNYTITLQDTEVAQNYVLQDDGDQDPKSFTGTKKAEITAKDITGAIVGIFDELIYTGSAQTPNASVTINGMTVTGTWSQVTNIGEKTIFTANGNFIGTIELDPLMKKAAAIVIAAPTPNTLTYDGSEQMLISAGEASGGTMVYSLSENGEYYTNIPMGKDADTYTVWYKVIGDANHSDIAAASVETVIAPKTVTITGITADDRGYNGETTVVLRGGTVDGLAGEDVVTVDLTSAVGTIDPNVGNNKPVTVTGVALGGERAGNYNLTGINEVKVNITAADQTPVITPTATVTKGGNTVDLKPLVSGAMGTVSFTISGEANGCTIDNGVLTSGTNEATIKINVAVSALDVNEDGKNEYNAASGEITVEVVNKTKVDLTVTQQGMTYDDTLEAPEYTAPAGMIGNAAVTYTGTTAAGAAYNDTVAPTQAGNYTVTVVCETATEIHTGSANFEIEKATVQVPDGTDYVYDTTAKTGVSKNDLYEITGDNTATNAGSYTVTVTLKDANNYEWASDFNGSITWSIAKAKIDAPTADNRTYTYNGTVQTYQLATNTGYTVSNNVTQTNAGSYTITVTLDDAANYEWSDGTSAAKEYTFVINKMTVTVPTVKTGLSYKGTEQEGVVVPEGAVYSVDGTVKAANAGNYTVTVALPDANNYQWSKNDFNGSITWSIAKANLAIVADNQEVQVGTKELPALTYTVYGLQNGESLTFEPTIAYETAPDLTKTGEVRITIAGDEYLNDNYNKIEYVYAKLTISAAPSDDKPSYSVKFETPENGSIKLNKRSAESGEKVTITVTPDEGYELVELIVTDKKGNEIEVTDKGDGKFTFKMPSGKVNIEAVFEETEADEEIENPFADVIEEDYFYDAVLWAADNGITNGMTADTFAPGAVCNRAQVVTFLWRAAGCPEPNSNLSPFVDVTPDAYYYDAVLWAVENGITNGMSATEFAPEATVTRGQTVTFLWRAEKGDVAEGMNLFTDVQADAYYHDAVLWAVQNSVTNGMSETTFAPDADCTRGQIVTFLYRTFAE